MAPSAFSLSTCLVEQFLSDNRSPLPPLQIASLTLKQTSACFRHNCCRCQQDWFISVKVGCQQTPVFMMREPTTEKKHRTGNCLRHMRKILPSHTKWLLDYFKLGIKILNDFLKITIDVRVVF